MWRLFFLGFFPVSPHTSISCSFFFFCFSAAHRLLMDIFSVRSFSDSSTPSILFLSFSFLESFRPSWLLFFPGFLFSGFSSWLLFFRVFFLSWSGGISLLSSRDWLPDWVVTGKSMEIFPFGTKRLPETVALLPSDFQICAYCGFASSSSTASTSGSYLLFRGNLFIKILPGWLSHAGKVIPVVEHMLNLNSRSCDVVLVAVHSNEWLACKTSAKNSFQWDSGRFLIINANAVVPFYLAITFWIIWSSSTCENSVIV